MSAINIIANNHQAPLTGSSNSSRNTSAEEFRQVMQTVSEANASAQAEVETSADADNNAAEEFSRYMAMSVADKIKHSVLQQMGLTEEDYDALPPEEKTNVDDKIAERIADMNSTTQTISDEQLQRQASQRMRDTLEGLNADKKSSSLFDITG
ncbi:hypothetical protein [Halopseudomonas salina]|uniref:Uncharacterized protein n=1 Tax=Halopseudomonas salina TaxID=1323744 RepID=A0ABQ1PRV2_9GAMM|nr:hypothetical protein [Halopseudomonas salina]GGD02231.1 hypothetical protein GCM10007418_21800 [Halopseudomonas salina]